MIEKLLIVRKYLTEGEMDVRGKIAIGADPWLRKNWDPQAVDRACWSIIHECLRDEFKQELVDL